MFSLALPSSSLGSTEDWELLKANMRKTGGLNYRNLPSILLQGFIALWSGAAIGPEGTLVFLTGGLGTFVSERLKLQKDDVQVPVYSAIAGAFGGFFGSPIVGPLVQ